MSRSNSFQRAFRALRRAELPTDFVPPSRRDVLKGLAAGAIATAPLNIPAKMFQSGPRIAIIGGGLSGLVCADRLESKGYLATVYEAGSRLGGRCFSNRSLVPGMTCENGGEFIDTGHKTMLAYANEFGLAREDILKNDGLNETYDFFGQRWTEAQVVEQMRAVTPAMKADARRLSGGPTFFDSNQADRDFDAMSLADYFAMRCAGFPLIEAVLNEAYLAEYGLETSQQSALNFLLFMRLNRQSKFEPFGVSDERFHLRNGNDGIVSGLAAKLSSSVVTGAKLTRLRKNGFGQFEMFFNGSSTPVLADYVVLTVPFSVLRSDVILEPSLGLSVDKRRAIDELGYGTNAKTMIGFNGRPWVSLHAAKGCYSDRANVQNVWETNAANAGVYGILTDYASGVRGAGLSVGNKQAQVDAFLTDLNVIWPGVKPAALTQAGNYVAHLEHWPSNPLSKGSYTCYKPGQFTTIAGLEGQAAGKLKFGGEHADSFYSWQGYMEGACLSGLRCAGEVIADIRANL